MGHVLWLGEAIERRLGFHFSPYVFLAYAAAFRLGFDNPIEPGPGNETWEMRLTLTPCSPASTANVRMSPRAWLPGR